jgi:hypothetical protein
MSKNGTRDSRAPKQNHKQTHRLVPLKFEKDTDAAGATLPGNLAFFTVDRLARRRAPAPQERLCESYELV